MLLQEEFEYPGSWLFRWRSYLQLALVDFLIKGMDEYRYVANGYIMRGFLPFHELLLIITSATKYLKL